MPSRIDMMTPDVDTGSPLIVERESSSVEVGEIQIGLARSRALERIKPYLHAGAQVVMEGESGVGKRFHARLLHARAGQRDEHAFVEVSAQTPEEVLRAILFDEDRKRVEQKIAKTLPSLHGRTMLFLRDIGDFSIIQQRIVSRFLIQQQGEARPHYRQTRMVVSTTTSWSDIIGKPTFVDSLADGMRQFQVCEIPPLRQRFDELPSLVDTILTALRRREKVDCTRVKDETIDQLKKRQWRDNVRELKYVIEAAAFQSSDGTLRLREPVWDEIDIASEMFRAIQTGKQLTIDQSLLTLEKAVLERALVRYDFDQRKTARMLAMTEPNLTYRIKKFNIYIPALK